MVKLDKRRERFDEQKGRRRKRLNEVTHGDHIRPFLVRAEFREIILHFVFFSCIVMVLLEIHF